MDLSSIFIKTEPGDYNNYDDKLNNSTAANTHTHTTTDQYYLNRLFNNISIDEDFINTLTDARNDHYNHTETANNIDTEKIPSFIDKILNYNIDEDNTPSRYASLDDDMTRFYMSDRKKLLDDIDRLSDANRRKDKTIKKLIEIMKHFGIDIYELIDF